MSKGNVIALRRRRTSFLEEVLAGREDIEAVDDYIDAWHASTDDDRPLHEFLGMTGEEFRAFGRDERNLLAIVRSRKKHMTLGAAVHALEEDHLAARGGQDLHELAEFLRAEGLLSED